MNWYDAYPGTSDDLYEILRPYRKVGGPEDGLTELTYSVDFEIRCGHCGSRHFQESPPDDDWACPSCGAVDP